MPRECRLRAGRLADMLLSLTFLSALTLSCTFCQANHGVTCHESEGNTMSQLLHNCSAFVDDDGMLSVQES